MEENFSGDKEQNNYKTNCKKIIFKIYLLKINFSFY